MFCNKCGKQFEGDERLCPECAAKEAEEKALEEAKRIKAAEEARAIAEEKAAAARAAVAEARAAEAAAARAAEAVDGNANGEDAPSVLPVISAMNKANNADLSDPRNVMFGFGKALTATILGVIGFIWYYIISELVYELPDVSLLLNVLGLALIIIPILFGINSIKLFSERKDCHTKPIPAFILGIVGLSWGANAALLFLSSLFVAFTL